MYADNERLIFSTTVAGKPRSFDPLALRRAILRESAGEFYDWWNGCDEPDAAFEAPLPPAEVSADAGSTAEILSGLSAAHRTSSLLAALDNQERTVAVIRAVFGIPAVADDGSGSPESECWRLIQEYTGWMEKNGSGAGK